MFERKEIRRNSFSFYERVKNLSDIVITKTEEVLLSKGLKHCVGENISLKHLEKLAACTDAVLGVDNETKLICKRKLKRYFTSKRDVQKIEQTQVKKLEKKLKETDTLAVKADKGNTTVLIKKNEYIAKVTEFLNSNDFEKMKKDPTQKFQKKEEDDDEKLGDKVKDVLTGQPLTLLSYQEAPSYLQFNPYIRTGYRGYLSTKMCFESMFWLTNETVNIWSHIFGWMLFLGLTLYDLCLLNIHASFTDKFIVGLLLACFQICMLMSSLYHIFSCRSEEHFNSFLSLDLLGIALSMLGIYMTGVYYAYWCHKGWQTFYLSTVLTIFLVAMLLQVPRFNVDSHIKLLTFVGWAAYGVVPTLHWTIMMGGLDNPIVALLLPRVIMMYIIIGMAFIIYITKIPERFFTGKVDYIGSSHQWWHFFVVLALYYWHNTGIKYIEYRMNHGCSYDLTS